MDPLFASLLARQYASLGGHDRPCAQHDTSTGEQRAGFAAASAMRICRSFAAVAQLVEHFTRNEGVSGSSPLGGLGTRGRFPCR